MILGEWVNEWNVMSESQTDYQAFGGAQLEVYNAASFGWAYWTLKNDRKHWDFEWNIRNNYLQLQLGEYSILSAAILDVYELSVTLSTSSTIILKYSPCFKAIAWF